MNIAVYCGSGAGNDIAYSKAAELIGKWIAKEGHTLVYGGGNVGLMGVVANTVMENGGDVIGVIPNILFIREQRHNGIKNIIDTKSMSERRDKMIELADAFIALPGGPGTLDEISEIIMMLRIRELDCQCVLFNTNDFYNPLRELLHNMVSAEFSSQEDMDKLLFSDDMAKVADFINHYPGKKNA